MSARLYPTPARRALLDQVAAGRVFRDVVGDDYISAERKVNVQLAELHRADWVELHGYQDCGASLGAWTLTGLGAGIRRLRMMEYGLHQVRTVAEIGPEDKPTVIGQAEQAQGIRGRWLITVGTEQALTTRSAAVAELWHMAALAVADGGTFAIATVTR